MMKMPMCPKCGWALDIKIKGVIGKLLCKKCGYKNTINFENKKSEQVKDK